MTLRETLKKAEREAIVAVLKVTAGRARLSETAKALGISRKNLWEKMRQHCIDKETEHPQIALATPTPMEAENRLQALDRFRELCLRELRDGYSSEARKRELEELVAALTQILPPPAPVLPIFATSADRLAS